ncbi:T6SS immunity protein Tdi1 domain-containing protein [Allobranchiibius sp. CTAmp26]|uniref:T6SS immunity protein Tdi1 domain-containing protein n=1 Tax=Allobranchiibius sp. CTAmp26 TaxID=2815214 RepID=UPI001AA158D5|nr:GAD-like domain-containing protein [Allobranchiibius sp. CTAmp26]MBO1756016.1 DUF1851 domain-containing protein [Allobranchiibius sp. CTAmp26]
MTQPSDQRASDTGAAVRRFVEAFPPGADVRVPSLAFLEYAEGRLPDALVELWRAYGLGFYGDQALAIVDPGHWVSTLQVWLGDQVGSVPFAVTSFGHLYHYERVDGRDVISCLDPHFQTNTVIDGDMTAFLGEHLPGPTSHPRDLAGPHKGARQRKGELREGEIYFFTPILALGGKVHPDNLDRGDGARHLDLIHERVGQQHR